MRREGWFWFPVSEGLSHSGLAPYARLEHHGTGSVWQSTDVLLMAKQETETRQETVRGSMSPTAQWFTSSSSVSFPKVFRIFRNCLSSEDPDKPLLSIYQRTWHLGRMSNSRNRLKQGQLKIGSRNVLVWPYNKLTSILKMESGWPITSPGWYIYNIIPTPEAQ